jgi:hypothetical protein
MLTTVDFPEPLNYMLFYHTNNFTYDQQELLSVPAVVKRKSFLELYNFYVMDSGNSHF